MKRNKRKNAEPLIMNYEKEFNKVFYVSIIFLILLAIPNYEGPGFLVKAMREFSESMVDLFPQLDVIAATRSNPSKTRVVLSSVLVMMPFQMFYFFLTMPAKVNNGILTVSQLLNKAWKICFITAVIFSFFMRLLYVVLPISGDDDPGYISRRFMPILESDIGAGLLVLTLSLTMVYSLSALSCFFVSFFNKEVSKQ